LLATALLAIGLLATGWLATAVLAIGLLATGWLATAVLATGWLTTGWLTTGSFTTGSLTANLSTVGVGSTGLAITSDGDGFNTELGAGRLTSTRAVTAGDSPAADSMAIAGRGEAATWRVGTTDAGTSDAGTGDAGTADAGTGEGDTPTAGAAATSDLAGGASLDSTGGAGGFATVDSERRDSVGRMGAAAARLEAGFGSGGRETTRSGLDGDTAFVGESSRNFRATDRSGRTASDRFSTVRGDATVGVEATGDGPPCWAAGCGLTVFDVATCGSDDGDAATCGTATRGIATRGAIARNDSTADDSTVFDSTADETTEDDASADAPSDGTAIGTAAIFGTATCGMAPRDGPAIGLGWFDTMWSLVERFTATDGASSRSFRVTAGSNGSGSARVGSIRGGTTATVGVAGTGRLGLATMRSGTLGETGVSVAASRSWRFTLDSSRNCLLMAGSTRGGVAAINGVAGFSAGPAGGVTVDSIAFEAGAFVLAFPESATVYVGISRSRSCRVAGVESFIVRATAVGRVVEPTRGVGTGTNSSRVSLMLRVAAVTPGVDEAPFLEEALAGFAPVMLTSALLAPDLFAPGTDETGLGGTARTATGRGVLPRFVDESADAFPSPSERETLTCRVSPIRRGKSFATTPRACPKSCAATTTANETQLRMANHPWFRVRTPKQSFGPRKLLST